MAAEADNETLRKELEQLRSDVSALTATLKAIAADGSSAAYETVRQSAQKAQKQAAQTMGAMGEEIAEKPFTSVLSAFGIGLVIGLLFSRRS